MTGKNLHNYFGVYLGENIEFQSSTALKTADSVAGTYSG